MSARATARGGAVGVASDADVRLLGLAVVGVGRGGEPALLALASARGVLLRARGADLARGDVAALLLAPDVPALPHLWRALAPDGNPPRAGRPLLVVARRAAVVALLARDVAGAAADGCHAAAVLAAWTPRAEVPGVAIVASGRHWGFVLAPRALASIAAREDAS